MIWWEWDLVCGAVTFQGAASDSVGFPPCDLSCAAGGWEAATHPDDVAPLRASLQACLEGEAGIWSCRHRIQQTDGAWHLVLNSGKVTHRGADGQPLRMMGVTFDVTLFGHQEDMLLRDAQMLANVRQSIVCTDLNGIVTYWSDGAVELYGWTAAEMLGRHFYDRMPTEEMRAHARMRMATAARDGVFRHEREDFRKDGTRIYVESRVFALRDSSGAVVGVIGTAHDITARRRAEAERIDLERQLQQAQKIQTVGMLAGGVAHEFNNILAAIIGNTELAMLVAPEAGECREYHERILESSRRARDLVRRILSFSRSHEPARNKVRINDELSKAFALIRATLSSNIELRLETEPDLPDVPIDVNQLHQVLVNLAANAGHAIRPKKGSLTLRTRSAAFSSPRTCAAGTVSAGLHVVLDVIDSGPGIDPAIIGKIFEPFFTTKPVGEGSGLGLAIVRSIVCGHGGGVDVTSRLGSGSTFTLYFPVQPSDKAAARA